ncbi:TVP38/TMEM64 family protein [Opitutus terrae]|uniref:TVP38/TMEM64 family membrane protein n=1 Tax=Opitutus terrae (strain DSM 11246 / JCM 15787 / PB90-1) TaxID=452637 RepID=B2A010_OPITP|nr:VTT domain-containing protein [Opitutus terrae]ACB77346.1 SNARE associated Golgi protein [Opitutus terrae PB90-1]
MQPHHRKHRKSRGRWLGLVVLLAAAIAMAAWLWGDLEWRDLVHTLTEFNAAIVFALMATLPIGGFSIMVVYLVAGAKFGPVLGGIAVAGATAVHLLASFWIARSFLRQPLQRFLERRGHRLPHVPEGENASVAAMAVLIPGLPYFSRNYLLALTDVPFRTYFWVCLPLYVARSYVTILIGDLGTDPDRRRLAILIGVYLLKLAVCAYLIWRIRRRIRNAKQQRDATAASRPGSAST